MSAGSDRRTTRRSVRRQLISRFAVVAALAAGAGGVGLVAVGATAAGTRDVAARATSVDELAAAKLTYANMRQQVLLIVVAISDGTMPASFTAQVQAEQQALDAEVDERLATWKADTTVPADQVEDLEAAIAGHREVIYDIAVPLLTGGTPGVAPPAGAESWTLQSTLEASGDRYSVLQERFDEVMATETEQYLAVVADAATTEDRARAAVILMLLATVATSVVLGLRYAGRLSEGLRSCLRAVESVASRRFDATVDVRTDDELGELGRGLNDTLAVLRSQRNEITASTEALVAASTALEQVSTSMRAAADGTSARTNDAAGAADALHAAAEATTARVAVVKDRIRTIAADAGQAAEVARQGTDAVGDAAARMARLGELTAGVGQVIDSVSSIAGQTSMLALNATIEAARAGVAGRGFAVVAEEVKNLAQASAAAAEQITQQLRSIELEAADAADAMRSVQQLMAAVDEAQRRIADAVDEQRRLAEEIAASVDDVATGLSGIHADVTAVQASAVVTVGGAESTSRSAAELVTLAERLRTTVR